VTVSCLQTWNRPRHGGARATRGLSLVELMVAIALGLALLTALTALFVNTSGARRELDRSAELHEAGRYALGFLRDELSHAGFYGPLVGATGTNDQPCATDSAVWADSLALHVRGRNQDETGAQFSCIDALRKPGTDAVFMQRASTCVAGAAGCDPLTPGLAYLQVSGCGEEYSTNPFVAAIATRGGEASPFTLRTRECVVTQPAPVRRMVRRIFFVATDDSLNYVDITPMGVSDPVLVSAGIENLQFEYAIDTDRDGSPDTYSFSPTAAQWPDVVGLRLWVLSRATEASARTEGKTFTMADVEQAVGADDRFKRHVFTSFVTFTTPQGLRE
jgi:type IV pilus assembly protein PilW